MDDGLDIPEFLRRPAPPATPTVTLRSKRARKIPYPKDGYAAKGLRKQARERLLAARRRHAERCRER
jgi:hypothetical protein